MRLTTCLLLLAASAACVSAQVLGGSTMLGMPAVTAGTRTGAELGYRFFAEATGTYNDQIMPVVADQNGENIQSGAIYGGEIRAGLYGYKRFRHWQLGINYLGGYRKYSGAVDTLSGPEQMLQVDTSVELSRRWTWNTSTQGAILSRPLGGYLAYGGSGLATFGTYSPGTDIFDNRTYVIAQQQTVTYQASARTAYTFGGEGFAVRRKGGILIGVDGYGAQGGVIHQLTRRTSVGAAYNYLRYDYPGQYGDATMHQLMLEYVHQFTRVWNLNLRAGAFRAEVQGLTNVNVDPAIAALFGTPVLTETFYKDKTTPAVQAHLEGKYQHHSIAFRFDRMVNPGNGVYLTSAQESAGALFSYTGLRRWNFGLNGGWNKMKSVGQALVPIEYAGVGVGFTYRFAGPWSVTGRFDERRSLIDQPGALRVTGKIATVGIAFSPGERPLSFW